MYTRAKCTHKKKQIYRQGTEVGRARKKAGQGNRQSTKVGRARKQTEGRGNSQRNKAQAEGSRHGQVKEILRARNQAGQGNRQGQRKVRHYLSNQQCYVGCCSFPLKLKSIINKQNIQAGNYYGIRKEDSLYKIVTIFCV